MPSLVGAHSHADGAVFRSDVQRALLRQGVTTVIAGQDGVSYAPGDGVWSSRYFAAINGPHPTSRAAPSPSSSRRTTAPLRSATATSSPRAPRAMP